MVNCYKHKECTERNTFYHTVNESLLSFGMTAYVELWILKCCLDCCEVHIVLRECDSKFLNKNEK